MPVSIVPDQTTALYEHAVARTWRGEWQAAETDLLQALEQFPPGRAAYESRRKMTAGLAWLYQHLGRFADAEAVLLDQASLIREVHGVRHVHMATGLELRAALAWREGRAAAAEALFTQARRLRETLQGRCHPAGVDSLVGLAAVHRIQGRDAEARACLESARDVLASAAPWLHALAAPMRVALERIERYLVASDLAVPDDWLQRLSLEVPEDALLDVLCLPPPPGAWDDETVAPPAWDGEDSFDFVEVHVLTHEALAQLAWSGLRIYRLHLATGAHLDPHIQHLAALRELMVSGGELLDLPDGLFDLPHLRRLDAVGHHLTQLSPRLAELRTLRHLDLSKNQLSVLPDDIGRLRQLEVLRVGHNQLSALPDAVAALPHLRELSASHNPLTHLPPGLGACMGLTTLRAAHAQLTELPSSLEVLGELRVLEVSHNRLASLPERLGHLTRLEKVDVSHNPLDELPMGRWHRLEHLDVEKCGLRTLPEALGHLSGVRTLRAGENKLESLPASLGQLKHLEVLDVRNNQLTALPDELSELDGMVELHVDANALTRLPDMGKWQRLERFSADGNPLSEVPPSLTRLPHLTYLSLASTRLQRLPDLDGDGLAKLEVLRLQRGELTEFPASWAALPALQELVLSNNRLATVPRLSSPLIKLNLSHNRLRALPEDLSLPSLQYLNLRHNRLSALPTPVLSCSDLRKLDVSGNALQELPDGVAALRSLTELDLSGNQFKSLPKGVAGVAEVRMTGNPIEQEAEPPGILGSLTALMDQLRDKPQDTASLLEASAQGAGGEWAHFLRVRGHVIAPNGAQGLLQFALCEPVGSPIAEAAEAYLAQSPPETQWLRPLTRRSDRQEPWQRTIALPNLREGVTLDGDRLLVLTIDRLLVYRVETGALEKSLPVPPHQGRRNAAAIQEVAVLLSVSANHRYVLVLDSHESLVWGDLEEGVAKRLSELRDLKRLTILNDGTRAVLQFNQQTRTRYPPGPEGVCLYDVLTGQILWEVPCDLATVARVHADQERLLVVASGQVMVYALDDARVLGQFGQGLTCLAFVDNEFIVAGNDQGYLEVWHVERGELLMSFGDAQEDRHRAWICDVAVHPHQSGYASVAAGQDKSLKVWDLQTGRCVLTVPTEEPGSFEDLPHNLKYSADGQFLMLAPRRGTLRLYDANGGDRLQEYELPIHAGTSRAVIVDGLRLYLIGIYQLATQRLDLSTFMRQRSGGLRRHVRMAATPDHVLMLSDDGQCRRWLQETAEPAKTLLTNVIHANHMVASDDGRLVVVASTFECQVWDTTSQSPFLGKVEAELSITDVRVHGEVLLVATAGGAYHVYDVKRLELIETVEIKDATKVFLDAEHQRLFSLHPEGISLWMTDGILIRTIPTKEHRHWTQLMVDQSGKLALAWAPHREALHVINLGTDSVEALRHPGVTVEGACWYQGFLVWGDSQGTLHVHDVIAQREVARWVFESPIAGLAAGHDRVGVALEGEDVAILAWTSRDGTPKVKPKERPAPIVEAVQVSEPTETVDESLGLDLAASAWDAPAQDITDLLSSVSWAATDAGPLAEQRPEPDTSRPRSFVTIPFLPEAEEVDMPAAVSEPAPVVEPEPVAVEPRPAPEPEPEVVVEVEVEVEPLPEPEHVPEPEPEPAPEPVAPPTRSLESGALIVPQEVAPSVRPKPVVRRLGPPRKIVRLSTGMLPPELDPTIDPEPAPPPEPMPFAEPDMTSDPVAPPGSAPPPSGPSPVIPPTARAWWKRH